MSDSHTASSQSPNGLNWRRRISLAPSALFFLAVVMIFALPGGSVAGNRKAAAVKSAPVSTAPPTISGSPVVGQTLTASTGSWRGQVSSYAYQWLRCDSSGACSPLSGATSSSYKPISGDVGYTLRVKVTASNRYGSSVATSAATAAVTAATSTSPPTNTSSPTISGTTTVGQTLSSSTGTWSGSPTSYAYQWEDCDSSGASCAKISGATSSLYVLQSGDAGKTLRDVVTATNSGGSSSATSAATAAVTAATSTSAPTSTLSPTISGTTTVGQNLSSSTGSWSGSPTSYAYRWEDCDSSGASCANISGAASSSYALQSGDAGKTLRVVVTATNSAGSSSATSAQTGVVASSTTSTSLSYPSSFYSGPAGTNILLPPNDGYPAKGAWIGEASANGLTQVQSREQYLGRKFNIYSYYAQNRCDPWPTTLASVAAAGYIPMISWFPTPYYADQIINGQADSCIKSFGNAIANQSAKALIRPYWEFNGGWQPFSMNSDGTRATAAEEKQMWQHTIDVLRTTNVFSKASVVWSVSEGYYNNGDAWNNSTPYPGDTYVDWVASGGYNHDSSSAWCGLHAGWCSFAESLTHGYSAPTYTPRGVEHDFRGRKPYLVGETGSVEDPNTPGRKGQWMIDMGNYAKTYMPGLYAIVYFDEAYNGINWSLNTSSSSMDGFKSFASDPYFGIPNS